MKKTLSNAIVVILLATLLAALLISLIAIGSAQVAFTVLSQAAEDRRKAADRARTRQVDVEIEALLQAYEDNPVSAAHVYSDAFVTVRGGVVFNIASAEGLAGPYVRLVSMGDEFGVRPLRCTLAREADAYGLAPGVSVDVRGALEGASHMSVQLSRCEVVRQEEP